MLRELARELSDRRRLPGPVDADDEDDGRALRSARQHRRIAEQRLDLLGERLAQVAELAARLEPPDELRRRRDADVGADQRDLEPLPRILLAGSNDAPISATSARRLFPSESRSREKNPARSSASRAPSSASPE